MVGLVWVAGGGGAQCLRVTGSVLPERLSVQHRCGKTRKSWNSKPMNKMMDDQ